MSTELAIKTSTPDAVGGNPIDGTSVTTGQGVVDRPVGGIGDPDDPNGRAAVKSAAPAGTEYGVVVRPIPSGTQPVSAAALPLPTGASTEATLASVLAKIIATPATEATLASVLAKIIASPATEATLALIKAKTDNLDVALSTRTKPSDTQPVSAAALPLPAGASTEATLALIKAKTDNLDVALSTRTKPADAQLVHTLPTPTFLGSINAFRTPGRAGTTGQKILALHNATGSTIVVRVTKVWVDLIQTVVKAITVAPPLVRLWKVTVLPTNGTALSKISRDSALASDSHVTAFGDASADGTGSGTTLTATLPAGTIITEEFAPRLLSATAVGDFYEPFDRLEFLAGEGEFVVLRALEGLVLFLDYTLATQNPTTDMWTAGMHFEEAAT